MSLPTIRRWWVGHWQVLGCPCRQPAGEHGYPNHAEAIEHISHVYATNWFARLDAARRHDQRLWKRLVLGSTSAGKSFIRETK